VKPTVTFHGDTAAGVKSVAMEARIIRADGTIEDLGTIAYWHESRWRRLLWRLSKGGRRR
jgi:hypothetical protein